MIVLRNYFCNYCCTAFAKALVVGVGSLLAAAVALADGYVPTSVGGAIGYGYGYSSAANTEAESSNLNVSLNLSAYIWQPWFITNSIGLSVGLATSATEGGGESRDETYSGNTSFDVFPASRVPFHLSYSRADSRTEASPDALSFAGRDFISTRLLLRQSYIGTESIFANFTWGHAATESKDEESTSDNANINVRQKLTNHNITGDLGYSTNDSTDATSKPERYNLSLSHSYSPGTNVTLNNSINQNRNEVHGIRGSTNRSSSENSQFSTFFGWRPDYKPLSVSGGARISSSKSSANSASDSIGGTGAPSETKSFGGNIGMSYQMSTRVRVDAQATATQSEDETGQSTNTTQSTAISYSSDQYLLSGFDYSWAANAAASASSSKSEFGSEGSKSEQNFSTGVNHRASRFWVVGRASTLNLGLAQGAGLFQAQPSGDGAETLSHSASMGLSTRGLNGTTFTSLGMSDSRSFSEELDTEFQQANATVSRNQLLNRFSTVNGSVSLNSSKVSSGRAPTRISSNARAFARYQHFRFLSVYGMTLASDIGWAKELDAATTNNSEDISWNNKVDYYIGRLSLSWTLNATKNGNAQPNYTFFFRATRSF